MVERWFGLVLVGMLVATPAYGQKCLELNRETVRARTNGNGPAERRAADARLAADPGNLWLHFQRVEDLIASRRRPPTFGPRSWR